jgi:hypothetical protein
METTAKDADREAKIRFYVEALAFFIEEPKAVSDPTLRLFIELLKDRITREEERQARGLGTQKQLAKAEN